MTQETRVYRISPRRMAELERTLRESLPPEADWRPVPHARFSVKALGVVLTCYTSGKVVLQGRSLDTFEQRFLGGLPAEGGRTAPLARAAIGSDEVGKGDYFGPLVVAAARVTEREAGWVEDLGVADSKRLTDARALAIAARLEQRLEHRVVALAPADYNRRYRSVGNLNTLLAEQHVLALEPLVRRHPEDEVVVDRFAREDVLLGALRGHGVETARVVQVPGGERHPAVAAASVLARAAFLEGLAQCAEACASDLHKGAGAPADAAARRVFEIGGMALLERVAKLHFKNTAKLQGGRA